MAWRGAGDSTVYKACSGANRRPASTWTQYAVRHQLPVQLDDGLTAPKWWPTSLPTPQARYSVSSVAVCCHMLNLTGHYRPDAYEFFDLLDAAGQVGRGVDEVIDPRNQFVRSLLSGHVTGCDDSE